MNDYTIILTKILGKSKYEELVDYSLNKIKEKYGNIKTEKALKIIKH